MISVLHWWTKWSGIEFWMKTPCTIWQCWHIDQMKLTWTTVQAHYNQTKAIKHIPKYIGLIVVIISELYLWIPWSEIEFWMKVTCTTWQCWYINQMKLTWTTVQTYYFWTKTIKHIPKYIKLIVEIKSVLYWWLTLSETEFWFTVWQYL